MVSWWWITMGHAFLSTSQANWSPWGQKSTESISPNGKEVTWRTSPVGLPEKRKGPDAKVIVLPFARYQLPRNLIRMSADETPPVGAVAGA